MDNHVILSPFFIDQPSAHLRAYAQADWELNVPSLAEGDAQAKASTVHKALADMVETALKAGKRPISIAGDCCASIAVMAGLQRFGLEPSLLWLDSHGDFNTWETTPSGFLGGMPLAMIAGLGDLRMPEAVGLKPVASEKIILADGRDLDPGERQLIKTAKIIHIDDFSALKDYPFEGPIYLHFDVDSVHLDDIPAVLYPAKGGPRASEVAEVLRHLSSTLDIIAVSSTIGVWNHELEGVERSDKVAWDLLKLLF